MFLEKAVTDKVNSVHLLSNVHLRLVMHSDLNSDLCSCQNSLQFPSSLTHNSGLLSKLGVTLTVWCFRLSPESTLSASDLIHLPCSCPLMLLPLLFQLIKQLRVLLNESHAVTPWNGAGAPFTSPVWCLLSPDYMLLLLCLLCVWGIVWCCVLFLGCPPHSSTLSGLDSSHFLSEV